MKIVIASFLSPKTKVRKSKIEGYGLFARKSFKKDEIVGIKGGHIVNEDTVDKLEKQFGPADLQITDSFYLAPVRKEEVKKVMMYLNHSCEPNVGVAGNVIFVAMRDIKKGEECTIDYVMIDDYEGEEMICNCGEKNCRKIITGKDWQKKELQQKYGNYFSWYLLEKIKNE